MEQWARWPLLQEHRASVARRAAPAAPARGSGALEIARHAWESSDAVRDAAEDAESKTDNAARDLEQPRPKLAASHRQQLEASRAVKTGRVKMRALEFLRYIPMDGEAEILASGVASGDPAASSAAASAGPDAPAQTMAAAARGADGALAAGSATAAAAAAAAATAATAKSGTHNANVGPAASKADASPEMPSAQGDASKSQALARQPASGGEVSLEDTDEAAELLADALKGTPGEAGANPAQDKGAAAASKAAGAAGATVPGAAPSTASKAADEAAAPIGIHVRGPTNFTYVAERERVKSAGHRRSRAAREQELLRGGIHDSARLFLSWDKGYPGMVLSVVKYSETAESRRGKVMRLSSVMMDVPRRRQEVPKILSDASWLQREGTSYARYFNKEWAEVSGDRVDPVRTAREEAWDREYHPMALDDPNVRLGKHRIVQGLDGLYLSVLPYTKKKVLKQELNEVFREKHPELPAELTLSKIRNLKREVLEHVRTLKLELSTAALAIVYFEKLVFKGVVDKRNRKLVMSVCLLLAYKLNEPKLPGTASVADLLEDIERVQSLAPRQVLEAEFNVFGHLLFHLNTNKDHVLTHFSRLLKTIETTPTEYLGEDLAHFYFPKNSSDDDSDDDSVSHAPPPLPPAESSRADLLHGIIVPLPVPVPKPQRHKAPARARKAAKALAQHFGLP